MPSLIHKRPDGTEKRLEIGGSKPLIIGRLPESEIQVRDPFISRVHCGIGYANNQFTLKDLGSTNGTYRNGARVFETTLSSGDKIQAGNTTLIFELDSAHGVGILRQIPQMVAPSQIAAAKPAQPPDGVAAKPPEQPASAAAHAPAQPSHSDTPS